MNYKKPAFWIIVAVLVVAIAVGVLFLTDPIRKQEEPNKSTSKLIDHSNSQTKTGSQDVFDSLLKQYPIISGLNGTYFTGELIGRLEMVSSWPRLGDESLAINSGELQIFNKDEELRSTGALVSAKKLPITQLRTYLDQHGLPMSLKIDLPAGDHVLILTFSPKSGREYEIFVFEDASKWVSIDGFYYRLSLTSNESSVMKEYTGKRLLWQESTQDNRPKDGSEYWLIVMNQEALSIVRRDGSKLFDHAKPYKKMTTNKEKLTEELDSRSFREYFSHQIPPGDIEAMFYKTSEGEVYGIYSSMGRALWLTHGEIMHRVFELSGMGELAYEVFRGLSGTTLMRSNQFNPISRTESLDGSYTVGEHVVKNAFRGLFDLKNDRKNDTVLFKRVSIESGMLKAFNDKGNMSVVASETQTGWMETTGLRPLIYDYMHALIAENQFPAEGRVLVTIYEAENNSSFFILTFSDGTKWFATYNFGGIFEISEAS